jgi:transcriptional regulator with XRE-family HTH domain
VKHYTLNRQAVAELREQQGMSQADLAERIGVADSYISLLESGTREPSAATALKIANTLGVEFAVIAVTKGVQAAQAAR